MKKAFLFLILPLMLTGCGPGNEEGHNCVDNDRNHYCDICSEKLSNCVDTDGDGFCDVCGDEIEAVLTGISIKKQPAKTRYYVGDTFDPTSMVVNAHYSDGTYAPVTDYTYSQEPLKLTDTFVTIVYKQYTQQISITVIEKQAAEDEYTATIKFNTSTFATKFSEGTNIDNEAKFQELLEYIDDQLEYCDLINKITMVKGVTRKVSSVTYLQIGSASADGSLTWFSKEKIYSIQVTAMAYSKYNDYGLVTNVDRSAHLNVAGTDYSLEVPTGEPTLVALEPVPFNPGINSFTISSSGGRVLISEMTITWRG